MTVATVIPYWDDPNQTWDTLILDGEAWPGLAKITGAVGRSLEVKKPKGSDGATIQDNGYDPAELSIQLRLGTVEDWNSIQFTLPRFHPRVKGGERKAVSISHPTTDLMSISRVYIKNITLPEVDDSSKIIAITITALEYVAPKKVKKPTTPGRGRGGGGQGFDTLSGGACARVLELENEYSALEPALAGTPTFDQLSRARQLDEEIPRQRELCREEKENAGEDDLTDNVRDNSDVDDDFGDDDGWYVSDEDKGDNIDW